MEKNVLLKREISFGKFAYETERKSNKITVDIEIRNLEKATYYENFEKLTNVPEISICGNIWNARHSDTVSCGQNIDELLEIVNTERMKRIWEIWKEYHLNDLKAGTKIQEEALKNFVAPDSRNWYTDECNYLESLDILEDRGYTYGSKWLYMPVPEEIINELKTI